MQVRDVSLADALGETGADEQDGKRILAELADVFARSGYSIADIGRISRMGGYQSASKLRRGDGTDEVVTTDLYKWEISAAFEDGPAWPVVQPAAPIKVTGARKSTASTGDTVVVFPDMQIGFYRHPDGELEPTHDPTAIEAALALTVHLRPSRVVLLGDNLDLPEFGKYRLSPAFAQTTQATIDYASATVARLRAAVPDGCTIDWLAGNHEERLQHWLTDNARAAFGLRQGNTPEGWPVLSVPHLCHLDDHGVTYHPGYPASDLWVTDNLKIIHGDRVKSRGSTAHKYLDEQKVSVIYGHIHRIERAHRTREDIDGPAEIMAASPGCLARIDGAVPSTKQGLDLDGRPLIRCEDWQQGVGVVTLHAGGEWDYETARISNGRAYHRGRVYEP